LPEGVAAMPTIGLFSARPPVEPQNWALPKVNTPPSDATSQYPPVGSVAEPTIGFCSDTAMVSPSNAAPPKVMTPPAASTMA
jgi:hypothetical protein